MDYLIENVDLKDPQVETHLAREYSIQQVCNSLSMDGWVIKGLREIETPNPSLSVFVVRGQRGHIIKNFTFEHRFIGQ